MIDQNRVENICNKYNINYKIYPNNIHIETALNTWIITDKDTHFRLKHKNKGVSKHMCHMHDHKFDNVNEVIDYINKHDTKTIYDRRKTHERRLDRLLREISIHNTNKNINNKSITI
jgi:hypothetical protein